MSLTPPGPYKATTRQERKLTLDHVHSFVTTQVHEGPSRMSDQLNAGATSETTRTWKTIHTIHTHIPSNKVNTKWWFWWPKASWHLSYRWEKKNPGNLSRPGPAAWQTRMPSPAPQRAMVRLYLLLYIDEWGRRVIGISGSLIWSKTLMGLIFNPCGEFRWSSESPVSQIHFPHLIVGVSGIFSVLLRFVQMLKRELGAGSYRTYSSLVKLQPKFLSLQWKTCLWAEL